MSAIIFNASTQCKQKCKYQRFITRCNYDNLLNSAGIDEQDKTIRFYNDDHDNGSVAPSVLKSIGRPKKLALTANYQ